MWVLTFYFLAILVFMAILVVIDLLDERVRRSKWRPTRRGFEVVTREDRATPEAEGDENRERPG